MKRLASVGLCLPFLTGFVLHNSTAADVRFSEVMYNPRLDGDLEYVELFNTSDAEVRLSGWRIQGGIRFSFTDEHALPARAFGILAKSATLLQPLR